MVERKNIAKTACVYVGIIFGAGFASGQEHITFFLRYGPWGAAGVVLAAAAMALCGWAVLDICVRRRVASYKDFMALVFGPRLGSVLDIVTGMFIFVVFSAMLAGTGALGQQLIGINFTAGVVIVAILTLAVLLFDLKGMVRLNILISPILVLGALAMGLLAIFSAHTPAFAIRSHISFWPASALIYAAYNMITAAAVLSALPGLVTTRRQAKWGAITGGAVLGIIGLVLCLAMFGNLAAVQNVQLPMLALAANHGDTIEAAYGLLLFLAIFTTAVTSGFSLTGWLAARTGLPNLRIKIALTALGIAAAHAGFSTIVENAYGFFGFLGLFVMVVIVIHFVSERA